MATIAAGLAGGAIGMLAGLFADPANGRRRRALVGQKARHALHELSDAAEVTGRDARNRVRGLVERVRSYREEEAIDEVIAARLRSQLGRLCSHPHAIEVRVHDGRVTLTGPVLASEADALVAGLRAVKGVRDVESRLERYEDASGVPSLQGEGNRIQPRFFWQRTRWSPVTRTLAGAGGLGLCVWGASCGGVRGALYGLGGAALFMRAIANEPLASVLGFTDEPHTVSVDKSIVIGRPVGEVFEFFRQVESFPRFMRHVREVRRVAEGQSRWTVDGPGGAPVRWLAQLTHLRPNESIAWQSVDDASAIGMRGSVRFVPEAGNATRLHVRLSYAPPLGALGHSLAKAFGTDPKHQLDDDLLRLKSILERGAATGREGRVRREDIESAGASSRRV